MSDFFRKLFDTSDFPARWNCGRWDAPHGYLHIFSDLAVWAAYLAIPITLIYFCGKKRREILFTRIVLLFAFFIVACGMTHLVEALIFYHPVYRFLGILKLVTAVVSWITVVVLWKNLPAALEMPGQAKLNVRLTSELARRAETEVELTAARERVREMTTMVTHDLRNPLTSALLVAEMSKNKANQLQDPILAGQMESLVSSLSHIKTRLDHLQGEIGGETAVLQPCPVDLTVVLTQVKDALAPAILTSGASIESDPLPILMGSREDFFHLLNNLLDNALKYRGNEPPQIEIRHENDLKFHRITVVDNGQGIPPGERELVFTRNFRGANNSEIDGTGLGLHFCKKVVEDLGGTIFVNESESGGTSITFTLPTSLDAA